MQSRISQAAKAIRQAEAVLVTAGAGIGVDSGMWTCKRRYLVTSM